MNKKIKILTCALCVVAFISAMLLVAYSTGTLEYVVNPTEGNVPEYSEKDSVDKAVTSWVLNEEYVKNHLPDNVLKNTLVENTSYEVDVDAYTTCYGYCNKQGDNVQIENITAISDAYAIGIYNKDNKSYYVVVFNTTYEEDGTFTVMQYERKV